MTVHTIILSKDRLPGELFSLSQDGLQWECWEEYSEPPGTFLHIMWWWHLSNKKGPGLLQFMVKDSHKAGTTFDLFIYHFPSLYMGVGSNHALGHQ